MKRGLSVILALAMFVTMSGCSRQEKKFPSRQINIVVHAAAGGGSDTATRMVGSVMEKSIGVPVVVENKPGASGSVAMQYVANSKADGYTLGTAPGELSTVEALGYAQITPDDVQLLGLMQSWGAALTVHKDSPFNTFEEFIEYAKAHPGELKGGNSGTGTTWHFASCVMEDECGVKINHVPFDGASGAITALLGKHCDFITVGGAEVLANVQSGDLKVLAMFSEERAENYPDVPTAKELGYNIVVTGWVGLMGPKDMPEDVKQVLVEEIRKGIESDEFGNLCKERGIDRRYMDPDEFYKFAMEEYEYYKERIPEWNITTQ